MMGGGEEREREKRGKENSNLPFQKEMHQTKALSSQPHLTLLPFYSLCLQTQSYQVLGLQRELWREVRFSV